MSDVGGETVKPKQPTDFQILNALEKTGRASLSTLATQTALSHRTIETRLYSLEKHGFITSTASNTRAKRYDITAMGMEAAIQQAQCETADVSHESVQSKSATVIPSIDPKTSTTRGTRLCHNG